MHSSERDPLEGPNVALPRCITRRWLQSLPDEDLRRVEAQLYADTGGWQTYAHARRLSDRWERAYQECARRGLVPPAGRSERSREELPC